MSVPVSQSDLSYLGQACAGLQLEQCLGAYGTLTWTTPPQPREVRSLSEAAAGAGFAVLETMGYAFVVLVQSGGDVEAVQQVLFLRGVLSPAAHMAWTGLAAAALFTAAAARWSGRAVLRFVVVFAVVVALHTAWDSIGSLAAAITIAVVSLALLTATAHGLAAPHRRPVAGAGAVSRGWP